MLLPSCALMTILNERWASSYTMHGHPAPVSEPVVSVNDLLDIAMCHVQRDWQGTGNVNWGMAAASKGNGTAHSGRAEILPPWNDHCQKVVICIQHTSSQEEPINGSPLGQQFAQVPCVGSAWIQSESNLMLLPGALLLLVMLLYGVLRRTANNSTALISISQSSISLSSLHLCWKVVRQHCMHLDVQAWPGVWPDKSPGTAGNCHISLDHPSARIHCLFPLIACHQLDKQRLALQAFGLASHLWLSAADGADLIARCL